MNNPFAKIFAPKEVAPLYIRGFAAIEGYKPSVESGEMYVAEVDDLRVLTVTNGKNTYGTRRLIATADISDSKFADVYGDKIIVIDREFKKLPVKQQLALIHEANYVERSVITYDTNFGNDPGDDISMVQEGLDQAAKIDAMRKYGVYSVNKANSKATKFEQPSLGKVAKVSIKVEKKEKTNSEKSAENSSIKPKMPEFINNAVEKAKEAFSDKKETAAASDPEPQAT